MCRVAEDWTIYWQNTKIERLFQYVPPARPPRGWPPGAACRTASPGAQEEKGGSNEPRTK